MPPSPTTPPVPVSQTAHGMRLYLLATMALYGSFGLLFLLAAPRLSATHTGAWFTDSGPAVQTWGWLFLAAAGLMDWSLISPHSRRARAAAFLATLFVGGAWGTAGACVTLAYGLDPTRPLFWGWVMFVHLFLYVQVAPRVVLPAGDALAAMPRALLDALEALVHDGPAPTGATPSDATPSASVPATPVADDAPAPQPSAP